MQEKERRSMEERLRDQEGDIRRRMEAPGVQTFVKLAAQCYLGKFSADKF